MERIQHATAINELFTEGNPQQAIPATIVTAKWLNDLQEEIANCIEGEGIALNGSQRDQLLSVLRKGALRSLQDIAGGTPFLVKSAEITQGAGNSLNIPPHIAYAEHVESTVIVRLEIPAMSDLPVDTADLDGATLHYVKLRHIASAPFYDLVVDTTAPDSKEVLLDSFTGLAGGAFTFTRNRATNFFSLGSLKLQAGAIVEEFSTDGNLAADSDNKVPTEKAVKSYVGLGLPFRHFELITTSQNWSVPAGVSKAFIIAIGGGAGGSGPSIQPISPPQIIHFPGAGGGSGEVRAGLFSVSGSLAILIGAKGNGGSLATNTSGGDTTVGSILTAKGGKNSGEVPDVGTGGSRLAGGASAAKANTNVHSNPPSAPMTIPGTIGGQTGYEFGRGGNGGNLIKDVDYTTSIGEDGSDGAVFIYY